LIERLQRAHQINGNRATELLIAFFRDKRGDRLQCPLAQMPLRFTNERPLRR
jgi:hypothetical protein